MPIEQIDCPLIAEIGVRFGEPFLQLDGINLYDIFDLNGGTEIGKQSNNPVTAPGTRLWYSDSVQRYTLMFSTADPAPFINIPVWTVTNGIAARPYNFLMDVPLNNYIAMQFTAIGIPYNAGVVIDPDPVSDITFPLSVPVPTSYSYDVDGSPVLPVDSGGATILSHNSDGFYSSIDYVNEICNIYSAFTIEDSDDNAIYDDIQSYAISNCSYIFYPVYDPNENFDLYPRIKISQPGPFGGAPVYEKTLSLKMQFESDRDQASWGWQQPCQNTGIFGVAGHFEIGPPFYLYGFKFDGSGYYRYSITSNDPLLIAELQTGTGYIFIIHQDGIYLFEDRGGLGTSLWVYRFPFPSVRTVQNYSPIKLPCEMNCVPLFDRRKY